MKGRDIITFGNFLAMIIGALSTKIFINGQNKEKSEKNIMKEII